MKPVLLVVATALAVAGGMQVMPMRNVNRGDTARPASAINLAQRVPATLAGWSVHDEPLGPTEFAQEAVAKNLNYDDYIHRVYSRGGEMFSLYIGYWSPGRMPVHKVASHTPDRCWTENGWRCEEMRFAEPIRFLRADNQRAGLRTEGGGQRADKYEIRPAPSALGSQLLAQSNDPRVETRFPLSTLSSQLSTKSNNIRTEARGLPSALGPLSSALRPAQWRRFRSPLGEQTFVMYWHLVGPELYDYGDRFNARPHPLKWWREAINYAVQGSQEQYFIRLVGNVPFEELARDAGFNAVLESLARLGLAE